MFNFQCPNCGEKIDTPKPVKQNILLRLLALAIGAESVSWLEVITALSLAIVAYFGLVVILSI